MAAHYDRLARVFDFFRAGDQRRWGALQKEFFKGLSGQVLHVGVGTGLEILNFPPGLRVTAVDLSRAMLKRARPRARAYSGSFHLTLMNAERLAFPDRCFDHAVAVCVFCSVAHPVAGLREVHRVLKPGGRLLLFEHVLSRHPVHAFHLRFMSLFTSRLEGTHLDRHTKDNVLKAGFTLESDQNVYLDIVKAMVARKAG
ncbi:MAG: class I SAM-dependent methyltransferase [Nitrospinaceae bacterium]|nr:MAG: class I SAM-dependent methyltransferase [Nitrospinaceae bacterium]